MAQFFGKAAHQLHTQDQQAFSKASIWRLKPGSWDSLSWALHPWMNNLVGLFLLTRVEDLTASRLPAGILDFAQGKLGLLTLRQVEETTSLDKGKVYLLGGYAVVDQLKETVVGGGIPELFADLLSAPVKVREVYQGNGP